MDSSTDEQGHDQALSDQRARVVELLDAEKVGLITGIVQNGHLMLRPNLDISCDVGAQGDVLSVLHAFDPAYLRLVLEAVLKITIESADELQFMEHLNTIALKRIFHSPNIMKNKKYVYTIGNWLTDEGKKAVARHFLIVICQILYLMEQCLQFRVIPDFERMFKPNSVFHSISDIFGFISRNLISGKTLLPKVMETIGFKPTYHWSGEDENNQSGRLTLPHRSFLDNNRESFEFKKVIVRDEPQEYSNVADRTVMSKRESGRKAGAQSEIAILKHRLLEVEAERDQYLKKCQDLERQFEKDESNYYRQQLEGRPTESSQIVDRAQQRINREKAQDSKICSLFNLMDQTGGTSFLLNQTQEAASNLEKHAKKLSAYQSNVVALYEQLKQTAKFLTDIIHSLGRDDSQIELLMQKINKLQLDMKEGSEVSEQVVNDTQKLAAELNEMSVLIEESLLVSGLIQSSFVANPQHEKSSEQLAAKNDELTQKMDELTAEMAKLKENLSTVREERSKFESQATSASRDKKELLEKYTSAMKLVEERDEELKNRENIIEELQSVASKKVDLPVDLEKEIEAQLSQIYSTLSDVTNKVHK